MAMNNTNYGYSAPGFSSPYSSTPSDIRTQRPRFGYSGPSLYPRPRSSASKPNPDSFSDSMINNYGSSTSRFDTSYDTNNANSYNDSYTSGSNYYSANESFSHGQSYGEASMMHNDYSLSRDNPGTMRDSSPMYSDPGALRSLKHDPFDYSAVRSLPHSDLQSSGILPKPTSQFGLLKTNYNSGFGGNNIGEFKGNFKKNSTFGKPSFGDKKKFPFARKFGKQKKMATKSSSAWRCDICCIDFTSQIPYDMHLRGAKHAKKIKTKQALTAVQTHANNVAIKSPDGEKSFFCELCNVKANSSLQLQTHLDGTKHKNKLNPKESKETPPKSQEDSKVKTNAVTPTSAKTNGSLVRSLPSDFGEPQPSKLTKFACDVCGVTVNSDIQLQQHLSSKKHQNKLEGKPVVRGKKAKMENKTANATEATSEAATANTPMEGVEASNEASTKVVGVKALASSFVQGETLQ